MAGETTSGDELTTTPVGYAGNGYDVCVLDKTHEVATGELEAGDIINMGTVPSGAIFLFGHLSTDDLDSNGTPALTLKVGTSDDDDGLLAANTVGQAGGTAAFDGQFMVDRTTTTEKTTVFLKVGTAAATAQAGTARLVLFYCTPSP